MHDSIYIKIQFMHKIPNKLRIYKISAYMKKLPIRNGRTKKGVTLVYCNQYVLQYTNMTPTSFQLQLG